MRCDSSSGLTRTPYAGGGGSAPTEDRLVAVSGSDINPSTLDIKIEAGTGLQLDIVSDYVSGCPIGETFETYGPAVPSVTDQFNISNWLTVNDDGNDFGCVINGEGHKAASFNEQGIVRFLNNSFTGVKWNRPDNGQSEAEYLVRIGGSIVRTPVRPIYFDNVGIIKFEAYLRGTFFGGNSIAGTLRLTTWDNTDPEKPVLIDVIEVSGSNTYHGGFNGADGLFRSTGTSWNSYAFGTGLPESCEGEQLSQTLVISENTLRDDFSDSRAYGTDDVLTTNKIINPPSGEGNFGTPNDMGNFFPADSVLTGVEFGISRFTTNADSTVTLQLRSVPADGSLVGPINSGSGALVKEVVLNLPNTLGAERHIISNFFNFVDAPVDLPDDTMIFAVVSQQNAQNITGAIVNATYRIQYPKV